MLHFRILRDRVQNLQELIPKYLAVFAHAHNITQALDPKGTRSIELLATSINHLPFLSSGVQ